MKTWLNAYKSASRKGKAAAIFFAAAGFCFYFLVINRFSAQTAEKSGSLSFEIAEKMASLIYSFREHTAADVLSLAGYFEHPLRKCAHFAEYGILGGLFCGSFLPFIGKIRQALSGKSGGMYVRCILLVMILAAFDEVHQYFVPGRYASVWDVLLDTCGNAFVCFVLYLKYDRKKKR